jgi:hypothetical protein
MDSGIHETSRWRGDIDENQFADWSGITASVVKMAAFEQFACNALAEEAASTSNDNLHRDSSRVKASASQPWPQPAEAGAGSSTRPIFAADPLAVSQFIE